MNAPGRSARAYGGVTKVERSQSYFTLLGSAEVLKAQRAPFTASCGCFQRIQSRANFMSRAELRALDIIPHREFLWDMDTEFVKRYK